MISYLIKRLSTAIPTLLVISIVIFTILALAPGNPLGEFASNPAITPEIRENIRKSLGLDQPIYIRYTKWILSFIRGDLCYSFTSKSPVIELIMQRIPITLWVTGTAYLFSFLIAFPLGIVAVLKRHSWIDQVATTFTFLGFSLPTFITGLLFILIFSVKLRWLPFIYDSTLQITNWSSFIEQIKQSIMPVCVLALYQSAILMRFFCSAILDELSQEYVRTAYAKGLGSFTILNKHILRNAMIPVITLIALDIPTIFTGALITEQVFHVPGIGALLIESIYRGDTPVIMSITFIYAILILIGNFIADFTYSFLDPRVKLDLKK